MVYESNKRRKKDMLHYVSRRPPELPIDDDVKIMFMHHIGLLIKDTKFLNEVIKSAYVGEEIDGEDIFFGKGENAYSVDYLDVGDKGYCIKYGEKEMNEVQRWTGLVAFVYKMKVFVKYGDLWYLVLWVGVDDPTDVELVTSFAGIDFNKVKGIFCKECWKVGEYDPITQEEFVRERPPPEVFVKAEIRPIIRDEVKDQISNIQKQIERIKMPKLPKIDERTIERIMKRLGPTILPPPKILVQTTKEGKPVEVKISEEVVKDLKGQITRLTELITKGDVNMGERIEEFTLTTEGKVEEIEEKVEKVEEELKDFNLELEQDFTAKIEFEQLVTKFKTFETKFEVLDSKITTDIEPDVGNIKDQFSKLETEVGGIEGIIKIQDGIENFKDKISEILNESLKEFNAKVVTSETFWKKESDIFIEEVQDTWDKFFKKYQGTVDGRIDSINTTVDDKVNKKDFTNLEKEFETFRREMRKIPIQAGVSPVIMSTILQDSDREVGVKKTAKKLVRQNLIGVNDVIGVKGPRNITKLELLTEFPDEIYAQKNVQKMITDYLLQKDVDPVVTRQWYKVVKKRLDQQGINTSKILEKLEKSEILKPAEMKIAKKVVILERPNPIKLLIEEIGDNNDSLVRLGVDTLENLNEDEKWYNRSLVNTEIGELRGKIQPLQTSSLRKRLRILREFKEQIMYYRGFKKEEEVYWSKEILDVILILENSKKFREDPFFRWKYLIKREPEKIEGKKNQNYPGIKYFTASNRFDLHKGLTATSTDIFVRSLSKLIYDKLDNFARSSEKKDEFSVLLFGRTGTGKTTFWERFVERFSKNHLENILKITNIENITTSGYYPNEDPKSDKKQFVVEHNEGGIFKKWDLSKIKHKEHDWAKGEQFAGDRFLFSKYTGTTPMKGWESKRIFEEYFQPKKANFLNLKQVKNVLADNRMEVIRKKKTHLSTRNHIEKSILFNVKKDDKRKFKLNFFVFAGSESEPELVHRYLEVDKKVKSVVDIEAQFLNNDDAMVNSIFARGSPEDKTGSRGKMGLDDKLRNAKISFILFVWPTATLNPIGDIYRSGTTKSFKHAKKLKEYGTKKGKNGHKEILSIISELLTQ